MATTLRSWASSLNNRFTSDVDQAIQYREAFFGLLQMFIAAGWSVEYTSDGVTANTGNLLLAATDVVYGTDGSQPLSYFVVQSPANWVTGGRIQISVVANEANTDTTPQTIDVYATSGSFGLPVSPEQNRPTTTDPLVSFTNQNLIPHAAAAPARWHGWYTTRGDVIFGVSTDSTGTMDFGFAAIAHTDAAPFNLEGDYRCGIYCEAAAGAFTNTNFLNSPNWRSFKDSGAAAGTLVLDSLSALFTSLTNGSSAISGALLNFAIGMGENVAAGRILGVFEDLRSVPNNATATVTQDGDTDIVRYVVVDDLIIPTTASQLPILL